MSKQQPSTPLYPFLWLLNSFHPLVCSVPWASGKGDTDDCAFRDALFSSFWQGVSLYSNLYTLQREATWSKLTPALFMGRSINICKVVCQTIIPISISVSVYSLSFKQTKNKRQARVSSPVTSPTIGFWPCFQHQTWIPTCGADLSSN